MIRADNPRAIVDKVFERAQPPLSREGANALRAYLELLLEWSQRINLTGFRDVSSAAEGLLYDGVEIAPILAENTTSLDIGAGAGGLSVSLAALRPDLTFRLVEPRTKRMVFLRTVARELDLAHRFDLIQDRAENLPANLISEVDVTYAQAVMPPKPWLDLARTLVKQNGLVLCLTSKTLKELDVHIPDGLSAVSERRYELPLSKRPRVFTALRKTP